MLLFPSSLLCVPLVWNYVLYLVRSGVVLCGFVVCFAPPPLLSGYGMPLCAEWYVACGFIGYWFSGCLVVCWLLGLWAAKFGRLVDWLVGCLVGWLLARCSGLRVCAHVL